MNVNFIELTSSEYLALATVDDKSFYYLTDTEELFQGEKKLSYKEWSGTQAQYNAAVQAGTIANGTIVTITDAPSGSGDLDEHIESFVYSSSGIHGIRYQNNVLQIYNSTTEQWENASTAVTVDQTYDGTSTNAQSGVAIESALTSGAVTKVGTSNVGSTATPIYLANGTPTIITPDSTPTSGSSNLITSGGVYTGVSNKLATSVAGDEYDSTATYSAGDYVIYNNTLYKVINGCTGVLPTDTNEFTPTSINAELADVAGQIINRLNAIDEREFNRYYGMCTKTTSIATVNGNKVITENDTGELVQAVTTISTVATGKQIVTVVTPESGSYNYRKTVLIAKSNGTTTITESYVKEAK